MILLTSAVRGDKSVTGNPRKSSKTHISLILIIRTKAWHGSLIIRQSADFTHRIFADRVISGSDPAGKCCHGYGSRRVIRHKQR